MPDPRRNLPSVSTLIDSAPVQPLLDEAPRALVVGAIRRALAEARGNPASAPTDEAGWAAWIRHALTTTLRPSLAPLINATGVVLHTNLGRAALPEAALQAMMRVGAGYSNLEYDLERGARGSRYMHCVTLLRELTGAEDAVVVNNGAAALVLALNSLSHDREAIVSRGELVEIGGSFRIPEIMERSGARLVEVGTTNRTHREDYLRAIGPQTGVIVKVHRSNFAMEGYVAEVSAADLAQLGQERGVPVVQDLGSGLLVEPELLGLSGEPTAAEAVGSGAALVVMSGDKLLGGPQVGIIVGETEVIAALRRNPLIRALRVDKLTLAALEATLALYRDPARALREIPTLCLLSTPLESLRARADAMASRLARAGFEAEAVDTQASVGGGAFPTTRIQSAAVAIRGDTQQLEQRLRAGNPPVVGRIAGDRLLLDLRSVFAREDDAVVHAVAVAMSGGGTVD